MGDAKSWRSQTITVNGKSNMQVYFPDSQPNTFHISNFNNGEIYVGLNEIPTEYSKQFVVKSMCTKVLGSPNGQNSIFIYNPNKHASQIQILSHKEDFDMSLLKEMEIDTKSLEANLKNDNIVRGYMCSLPSGNNHIGDVTIDNLQDTNKYLSEIKNGQKDKEILAKLDNLNKLDDISEIKTKIKNDEIINKLADVENAIDFSSIVNTLNNKIDNTGIIAAISNGLNFNGIIESLNNLKTSIENIQINIPSPSEPTEPINPDNVLNDDDIVKINEIKTKIDNLIISINEIETNKKNNDNKINQIYDKTLNENKKYSNNDWKNGLLIGSGDGETITISGNIKRIVRLLILKSNTTSIPSGWLYLKSYRNNYLSQQFHLVAESNIINLNLKKTCDKIEIVNYTGVPLYYSYYVTD